MITMKRNFKMLLALVVWAVLPFESSFVSAIVLNSTEYKIDTLASYPAGPGGMYYQLRMTRTSDGNGRIDAWLLRVDTKNPYVSIEEVLGRDAVIGTERPSAMAVRKTTPTKVFYGGTNGDFYATSGDVGRPTGLTIVNQEFAYTQAATGHRVGAVDESFRGVVGNAFKYSGKLVLPDTTLTIKHVNYNRNENELVLYNQHNGASTLTNAYGVELGAELVAGEEWHTNGAHHLRIVSKEDGVGSMLISAGKAVLSGHGTMAEQLRSVNVGDTVTVNFSLKIDDVAYNISQSIGADNYCLIADNGRAVEAGFWDELHPRTAFGHSLNRDTLLFLVVDGRGQSAGCNTRALGQMMVYYGAYRAVNWDGGGSSCLYIRPYGEVNHGSDGSERAVANAMFAVANVPTEDTVVSIIHPSMEVYTVPRYGVVAPKFLGYNQYGVLIKPVLEGVTLSAEPAVGKVMQDGTFLASGSTGCFTAHYGNVTCEVPVRIMANSQMRIKLDTAIVDSYKPYKVDVLSKVGQDEIAVLADAFQWTSLNEEVCTVDETGTVHAVANGCAEVVGTLGDFADTLVIRVENPTSRVMLWDDFQSTIQEWQVSSSEGFNPTLSIQEADGGSQTVLSYTYKTARGAFLSLDRVAPFYGLPDSISFGITMDNTSLNRLSFMATPRNASDKVSTYILLPAQNETSWITFPVSAFGNPDDRAIYPLSSGTIKFLLATANPAGQHNIALLGIRLIYNAAPEQVEDALEEVTSVNVDKILENGQIVIRRGNEKFNVLGGKL